MKQLCENNFQYSAESPVCTSTTFSAVRCSGNQQWSPEDVDQVLSLQQSGKAMQVWGERGSCFEVSC